jgi:ubiquinone/menaquinone biosynthesis C-methylase UbiE
MAKYRDTISARWTARYDASLNLVEDFAGKRMLDIGCSFGWFEGAALRRGGEKVVGIDRHLEPLLRGAGAVPQADFCQAGAKHLPFQDDSFDLAAIWEVIEHLPKNDVSRALGEIRRVLKPNGTLLLSTPKFDLRSTLADPAWYFGHRHYRRKTLVEILCRAGFHPVYIRSGGAFFEVLSMLLFYPFKHIAGREVPGKIFLERKRREEYLSAKGWCNYFILATTDFE